MLVAKTTLRPLSRSTKANQQLTLRAKVQTSKAKQMSTPTTASVANAPSVLLKDMDPFSSPST